MFPENISWWFLAGLLDSIEWGPRLFTALSYNVLHNAMMLFHWHKRAVLLLESVMLKGLLHCQTTVYNRGISWSVKLFWAKLRVNQVCRLYCSSQYKLLLPVWDHFKLSPVGCLGTLHLSQGKNWYVFCHALHFQRNHLVTKHYDMSCRRLFGGFLTFFLHFLHMQPQLFPLIRHHS